MTAAVKAFYPTEKKAKVNYLIFNRAVCNIQAGNEISQGREITLQFH